MHPPLFQVAIALAVNVLMSLLLIGGCTYVYYALCSKEKLLKNLMELSAKYRNAATAVEYTRVSLSCLHFELNFIYTFRCQSTECC